HRTDAKAASRWKHQPHTASISQNAWSLRPKPSSFCTSSNTWSSPGVAWILWAYKSTARNNPRPSKEERRCDSSAGDVGIGFSGMRNTFLSLQSEFARNQGHRSTAEASPLQRHASLCVKGHREAASRIPLCLLPNECSANLHLQATFTP